MSSRFLVNLIVLLLGAILVVVDLAFSAPTVDAVGLVVGGLAVLAALISFALPGQGAYQRSADVVICVLGTWAIVAARVLSYNAGGWSSVLAPPWPPWARPGWSRARRAWLDVRGLVVL